MDDWNVSEISRTAASGQASNPTRSVTLTQARFFMDDGTWPILVEPFGERPARQSDGGSRSMLR